jgi:hypothetical protein
MEQKPLTRQQKIDLVLQLQARCKDNTAIDSEFTIGKFDFLVSEGIIDLTAKERETYMDKAKQVYIYELDNMRHTGTLIEGRTAAETIIRIAKNTITFDQLKYITGKLKVLYLRDFLTKMDILKFDGIQTVNQK